MMVMVTWVLAPDDGGGYMVTRVLAPDDGGGYMGPSTR